MANDRDQYPANPNESGGRQGPDGSQGGTDNQNSQTEVNSGNESEEDTDFDGTGISGGDEGGDDHHDHDDSGRRKLEIPEFEKTPDEYRQNQQEEVNPDLDGDDRDAASEDPSTTDGSSSSND